ncbi:MAG: arylesterase [Rhodothalassiaceae bacterium]
MSWKALCLVTLLFVFAPLAGSAADPVRVLILGDSLTAGFGLEPQDALPEQLERWLNAHGHDVRVINAGVSGDTTTGGAARLAWVLDGQPQAPDMVVVALGGNDILRSVPVAVTEQNLTQIIETLQQSEIPVLLAGMLAPPNLGADYAEAFNTLYPGLADRFDVALYPFFLDGVADRPDLHQPDGIHPNAEGVGVMVERFGPALVEALTQQGLLPAETAAAGR